MIAGVLSGKRLKELTTEGVSVAEAELAWQFGDSQTNNVAPGRGYGGQHFNLAPSPPFGLGDNVRPEIGENPPNANEVFGLSENQAPA